MAVIISAVIGPEMKSMFDALPTVTAKFSDGSEKELFSFYPDEISFTEPELIGLTEDQAFALLGQKDLEYLRA